MCVFVIVFFIVDIVVCIVISIPASIDTVVVAPGLFALVFFVCCDGAWCVVSPVLSTDRGVFVGSVDIVIGVDVVWCMLVFVSCVYYGVATVTTTLAWIGVVVVIPVLLCVCVLLECVFDSVVLVYSVAALSRAYVVTCALLRTWIVVR